MLPPAANRPRFPEASAFMGSNPGLVPQTADQREFACNANDRALPFHATNVEHPTAAATRESIPNLDILKWNVSKVDAPHSHVNGGGPGMNEKLSPDFFA